MALPRVALTMDWDFSTGGELLLRRKEIVRRRFLRIGQNDQRLRHEKRRTMNSREQTLTRGGLTKFKYRRSAKIPEAQNISSVLDCVSRNRDLKCRDPYGCLDRLLGFRVHGLLQIANL